MSADNELEYHQGKYHLLLERKQLSLGIEDRKKYMATATTTRGGNGRKKRLACVTGGSGYLGSMLVKCLLENGYSVHATVRDTANVKKVSHLLKLQSLGDLKVFRADLTEDGSFDEAINGCDFVFNVATPVDFESQDQENDMIRPGVNGMLNVLKSCAKVKTMKRVVCTSSAAALSVNQSFTGMGHVVDEESWSDVEYLTSEKPPRWGYAVSKTLAEKAGWEFTKENNLDFITVVPVIVAGPSITPEAPSSMQAALSLLTGNEDMIDVMKGLQLFTGSISLVHVEDVCRAHIFVAEKEAASGRYICCVVNTSMQELAQFLAKQYPQYNVPTHFSDVPEISKLSFSTDKLIKAGFTYKYGIEEIFDDSVEYYKDIELLAK